MMDYAICLDIEVVDTKPNVKIEIKNYDLINTLSITKGETLEKHTIDSIKRDFSLKGRKKKKIIRHEGYRLIDKEMEEKSGMIVNLDEVSPRLGAVRYVSTILKEEYAKKERVDLITIIKSERWVREKENYSSIDGFAKEMKVDMDILAEGKAFLIVKNEPYDITQVIRQEAKRVYTNLLKAKSIAKMEEK